MKILIAYDGSECAESALDDLRSAGLPDDAKITVVSIRENWLPPISSLETLESIDREMETHSLAQRAAVEIKILRPSWEIDVETAFGSPATAIIEKAEKCNTDLIIIGSHGRSAFGRFFLGSVSQKLLHDAHCSVRIARGKIQEPDTPLRILIGFDGSKYSEAVIDIVAGRCWPAGTEIRLVTANAEIPTLTADESMSTLADWVRQENLRLQTKIEIAAQKLQQSGLKVTCLAKPVDPKKLLIEEAEKWGADSIFVGARGVGPIERFLIGSVSATVAARAHCSVEVVRTSRSIGPPMK